MSFNLTLYKLFSLYFNVNNIKWTKKQILKYIMERDDILCFIFANSSNEFLKQFNKEITGI